MEIATKYVNKLPVKIYTSREKMGYAAAQDAANRINQIINTKGEANVVFAAAPSQNELIAHLLTMDIDWSKVRGFHQDEYVGISSTEPAGFGNFLDRAIFKKVNFKEIHYMLCDVDQSEEKCIAYTELMKQHPIDLIFLGVGENGHLAFNDPSVADFNDPKSVKIVELDDVCRQQQVNDGCFATIDDVPKQAMTLTMSCIMNIPEAICVVPGPRKANAIFNAVAGPVAVSCPASILRNHANAVLYLDVDSAALILDK